MRAFKIFLTLLFVSTLFSLNAEAQKKNRHLVIADKMYANERYFVAIDKYKKAYTKVKRNKAEKARIALRIADCYRMVNDPRRAKGAYKRAIRMNDVDQNPQMVLHYADMLKLLGQYDDALVQYETYKALVPEDTLGIVGVESCKLASEWVERPTNYQIENQKKINSKQSDFAPVYADKFHRTVIFTSSREGSTGKEEDEWTGHSFSDLYYAKVDNRGNWSTPVLAEKKENMNTAGNEGAPWFTKNFTTVYYTRCPNEEGSSFGCQIFKSSRSGKSFGKGEIVELGKDTNAVYAHPTLTENELTIIFASTQKDGLGGKDLYFAERGSKGDKFGKIQNMGAVLNTPGDEMFPYLRNDSTLYFASNGHAGLGGLDIFISRKINGQWTTPENMRYPMNTNWDDFGITFHEEDEQGYFSSNRKGGRGADDIYYFTNPPLKFSLAGVVKDNSTLQFIEGVRIRMVGSDGSSVVAKTDPKGFYSFSPSQIKPNTSYEMMIDLENFFNKKATVSTVGVERSEDIIRDFLLDPIPDEPVLLPEILYDLAKWDLKPQYQDSLQGLIETLDANETIIVELASHTDSRDSDERNDILSQKRAQSAVDYLILRGIDGDRLVAKGYGERVPRTLMTDITRAGYTFTETSSDISENNNKCYCKSN
jgi:peptidoglycan-associated lipoprotein